MLGVQCTTAQKSNSVAITCQSYLKVSSLNVELYRGLALLVLRSSLLATRGDSCPASLDPPSQESREESSALRELLEDVAEAFLVESSRSGGGGRTSKGI